MQCSSNFLPYPLLLSPPLTPLSSPLLPSLLSPPLSPPVLISVSAEREMDVWLCGLVLLISLGWNSAQSALNHTR